MDEEGRIIREANRAAEELISDGWRRQISDTKEGSAERLSVIDAALQDEKAQGMDATANYRGLMDTRVTLIRHMTEEAGRMQTQAGREEAANVAQMGMLRVAAERQAMALADSGRRVSDEQRVAEESQIANELYEIKHNELEAEIEALDQSSADYLNKLKALQDKERQLYKQHEDELTNIKDKATQQSNNDIVASYRRMVDDTSRSLTQSIMGHQTWSKMLINLGDQVVSAALENAIKSALTMDFGKEKDAAKAARKAFNYGMEYGGPAAPVLAPILAAGAFTAVMAFAGGTDRVPGVGRGDVVPSMLTPGEGVVPGGVMDGLRNVARSGGFAQSPSMTVHVQPTYHVQTISGDGMKAALEKHSDQLQQHFEGVLRKMNR